MNYSQNNEQEIIKKYFGNFKGNFLDIGANDGKTLSNTHQLALDGWGGVCVEPSRLAFEKLTNLYQSNKNIVCLPYAIGAKGAHGMVDFYESGEHLGNGDNSLLSTLDKNELSRWVGTNNQFEKKQVEVIDFDVLYELSPTKKFDLISIDIEGLDYDVLKQINMDEVSCRMLIVETNGKDNWKFMAHMAIYKMKLHAKNHENLIFVKQ